MNVPEIRRNMHLAYANLTPEELEASQWPVVKFLLEGWDADRGAVRQVAIERENAWNEIDRYRQQIDRVREANTLLVEELACSPAECIPRLLVPDGEGIRHVSECEHGRVFVWEDGWQPLPVRGEEGWKPAGLRP
jgi:hypothetical protein